MPITYGGRDIARRRKLLLYGTIGVPPPRIKATVIKRRPGAQQYKLKSAWKSSIGVAMKKQMKKSGAAKSWNTPAGKKFKKLLKK